MIEVKSEVVQHADRRALPSNSNLVPKIVKSEINQTSPSNVYVPKPSTCTASYCSVTPDFVGLTYVEGGTCSLDVHRASRQVGPQSR